MSPLKSRIDYNQIAFDYARHRRVHPEIISELVTAAPINSKSRVLEIGCGTGNYINTLQEITRCRSWGIDPHEQMLSIARESNPNVTHLSGSAENLEFPPESFDLVFSVDVIHHISDREKHFQEAYRVLAKGGRICTATDSEEIIRNRMPMTIYFPETVEVELKRYPRIADLREYMRAAGFTSLSETLVSYRYTLTDAGRYRDKAFSALHLISDEAFQRGMERLERDLQRGPITGVSRYILCWAVR